MLWLIHALRKILAGPPTRKCTGCGQQIGTKPSECVSCAEFLADEQVYRP